MTPDQDEIVQALGRIPDSVLLTADPDELEAQGYEVLDGRHFGGHFGPRFNGMVIRLPGRINIGKHAKLPAIIAVEHSHERAMRVPLSKNAVMVITRLGSGGCGFADPYAPPPNKIPFSPDEPGRLARPELPAGVTNMRGLGVIAVDVRPDDLPWQSGRYAVRLISSDWKSNTQIVTLSETDAAPAPGISQEIKGRISLNLPESVGGGAPIPANGSLTLQRDAEWPITKGGGRAIPTTILLTRPDILYPIVIGFDVPVSEPESDEAEGRFALDLRAASTRPLPEGMYFAYLIAGEHLDGPVALELTR